MSRGVKPPRTKRKLGAVARAELGVPRECEACGDTKEVSEATFTPYNKGKRGWKTVCKVCEAASRSGRKAAVEVAKARKLTDREDLEALVDEMYIHSMSAKPDQEVLDHCVRELGAHVRRLAEEDKKEDSFRAFVEIVKPLIANWVEPGIIHDDIIRGLMSDHRRRLIIATRYSAKSTLTAIYVAWRIFLDPLIKVMVVSRGSKLAARMLRTVRHVFIAQCPVLAHLVPTEDCLDNAEQFQVPAALKVTTGGATLTSLGITSNLPGYRSDLTIADDVEGPQDDTPEKVMALNEILTELHMINPKGEKVMLGTYQSEFSIYAVLADQDAEDGAKVWQLHRACMFEEDEIDGKKTYHSRWSNMFSDKDAYDWRQSVTERSWRLHAMLVADPSILNEKPLKIKDLLLVDWPKVSKRFPLKCAGRGPEVTNLTTWGAPKTDRWYAPRDWHEIDTQPYNRTIVAIDPASGLAGRDAIGVAVLSVTQTGLGVIRWLEGVRGPDKLSNIGRVAAVIIEFGADQVIVEELADGLFGDTLGNQLAMLGHPMHIEKVTTGGQQKGRRIIETLAPPMGNQRIAILREVAQNDHGGDFVQQMIRISWDGRTGAAKDHDDIVDALAHAVKFVKADLVSDMGDNLGEVRALQVDNWRGLPSRFGGLGSSEDSPGARTINIEGSGVEDDRPLGERLYEEDQVLVKYEALLDALREQLQVRIAAGWTGHYIDEMRKRMVDVQRVVNELKGVQVL